MKSLLEPSAARVIERAYENKSPDLFLQQRNLSRAIPSQLTILQNQLRTLNINICFLKSFPMAEILSMPQLHTLNLSHNYISRLDNDGCTQSSLESLIIMDNEIEVITDAFLSTFPRLKSLNLTTNSLDVIPNISLLPNLEDLNLSYNCITVIDPLAHPTLQVLDISHNHISILPGDLQFHSLARLYIHGQERQVIELEKFSPSAVVTDNVRTLRSTCISEILRTDQGVPHFLRDFVQASKGRCSLCHSVFISDQHADRSYHEELPVIYVENLQGNSATMSSLHFHPSWKEKVILRHLLCDACLCIKRRHHRAEDSGADGDEEVNRNALYDRSMNFLINGAEPVEARELREERLLHVMRHPRIQSTIHFVASIEAKDVRSII